MRSVRIDPEWQSFRDAARALVAAGCAPACVSWTAEDGALPQLALLPDGDDAAEAAAATGQPRVPRAYIELAEMVSCYRAPAPWPLLYRVLWRITHGDRDLMRDAADADVACMTRMGRAVRRDMHKMTAFVRFRPVRDADGERFVAWFEPQHRIVRQTAPFFERRFPAMRWSILTPDACAHWDGERLSFDDGVARPDAGADDVESLWLTYYANTFNPARVRVKAMRAEMPVHYWRNLPEAASIRTLLNEAPARVRSMIERSASAAAEPSRRTPMPRPAAAPRPRVIVRECAEIALPVPARRPETPRVRIGVAGWDYPDWAGRVYPAGRDGVDRLRHVAVRFDLVEVNSTFYRPASPRATRAWLERTTEFPAFRFAAKLSRVFTHERSAWREAEVAAVNAGMAPLLEAGKLVSLLVQFPWSFRNLPDERRRLRRIVRAFSAYPLHVEVRHDSWDDAAFRSWLHDHGVGLAAIDQPMFDHSIAPSDVVTGRTAYLRLHGRNSANWFRADATRDERYDYDYPAAELLPWAGRAARMAARPDVDEVEVVFNNHYRGQAVTNAEAFRDLLHHAMQPRNA